MRRKPGPTAAPGRRDRLEDRVSHQLERFKSGHLRDNLTRPARFRSSLKRNSGIAAGLRPYSPAVLLSRELMNSPTSIATTTTR